MRDVPQFPTLRPGSIADGTESCHLRLVAKHLKLSAEAGCQSCLLIWNALSLFREPWGEQDLKDAIKLQVSSAEPLLVLFRPRKGIGLQLDIYTNAGETHLFCVCGCVLTPSPSLSLKIASFLRSGQLERAAVFRLT
jgi:hypothetical protein